MLNPGMIFAIMYYGGDHLPCIMIKAHKTDNYLDTKAFAEEFSKIAEINISRINVIVDYYQDINFYNGDMSYSPIVFISLSKKNGTEFIQKIASIISNLTAKHFLVPSKSVSVFCNASSEGYLLVNGEFK